MDKRTIFVMVFFFTLISTILVAIVCVLTGQKALTTVLYSLATMWITGIISQLLFQSLYQSVVVPREEVKQEQEEQEPTMPELNLEGLEEIEEVQQHIDEKQREKPKKQAEVVATATEDDT